MASVVALVITAAPANVMAEGGRINARSELEYQYSDISSKDNDTSETTDSEFSRLKQKYDLELQKEIFPFLEFRTGGYFELIDVWNTTEGVDSDSDERTRWLFAELNLDTPLYIAGTSYRRRKFDFNTDGIPNIEIKREEWRGLFRWRPVGLPLFDLNVDNVRTWDKDDTADQTVERIIFKSRYDYKDLAYNYTYTRSDIDEKIRNNGGLTQIHNGLVNYNHNFFGDQLQLTSSARLDYQTQNPDGDGVIDRPTSPPGVEFFYTDDDDDSTLTPVGPGNPLTTINIGRNGPFNPVSIGLDFGIPTEVNRVYILPLIDPDDPLLASAAEIASVADDYVWTVYWSDDQLNWTELNVIQARYTIIDNRFEITFTRVDGARFIKVVTDPQPDAPGEIRTAEIRSFRTVAVDPGDELEDLDQTYNLGLRWLISDKTEASYEGFFRHRDTKPFDITRKTLTNSISLRHYFNPRLFASGRVLRTDTTETNRDDLTHHSYSASLRADYLDTLNQTLIYSGFHDDLANSIFLRTNADLYEGWSSNVDLGYSARHLIEGGNTTSTTFRIGTDVEPNPTMTFVIDYRISRNNQTGESSWLDQHARFRCQGRRLLAHGHARFQGFWVPVRTLSFFAAVRLRHREREDEGLQVSQDYSVNWAAFPDGLLRFSLSYNRSKDTRSNTTSVFSPQIDWEVTRTTLLAVRFNIGTVETDQAKRDIKNVRLTFKTWY